jgi:hypothetical protein
MATPAAPSKVFNNPRLLLLTLVLLTVGFLSSGLETFAETLALTGMESLIGDDDEREGNKRVLPVNSLPNDVGVKRAAIPVAVAMVYCTHSVFKQSSSVENNNSFLKEVSSSFPNLLLQQQKKKYKKNISKKKTCI